MHRSMAACCMSQIRFMQMTSSPTGGPKTPDQQNCFASDVKELIRGLEAALSGNMLANRLQDWLREMFGDRVVTNAVDMMARDAQAAAAAGTQGYTKRGGILVPAAAGAPIAAAYTSPVRASPHTYFGDRTV